MAAALLVTVAIIAVAAGGCRSMPLTGRTQLVMIPESQEIALGREAFERILAGERLCKDPQLVEMVSRVGHRIAAVAHRPDYDWEFRVIAGDAMNAFALPGGKVAVYEGLLPVCQDEAGLAVVLSHEIAHVLARHGGERLSQQSAVALGGGALDMMTRKNADDATAEQISRAYGAATTVGVILPFSRMHESEADAIGLILMARAGYDPSAAPEFWQRFARSNGQKIPEWLSTHPADGRRVAQLRSLLPEAMNYYDAAPVQLGLGDMLPIGRASRSVLADVSPHGRETSLPGASFPSAQRHLTGRRELPVPDRGRDSPSTSVTTAGYQRSGPENFHLPRTSRPEVDGVAGPKLPDLLDPPVNDGWHPATGRAVLD